MIKITKTHGESLYLNPDEISSFHDIHSVGSGSTTYITMKNGTVHQISGTAYEFETLINYGDGT